MCQNLWLKFILNSYSWLRTKTKSNIISIQCYSESIQRHDWTRHQFKSTKMFKTETNSSGNKSFWGLTPKILIVQNNQFEQRNRLNDSTKSVCNQTYHLLLIGAHNWTHFKNQKSLKRRSYRKNTDYCI